jgi:hypothetical protein
VVKTLRYPEKVIKNKKRMKSPQKTFKEFGGIRGCDILLKKNCIQGVIFFRVEYLGDQTNRHFGDIRSEISESWKSVNIDPIALVLEEKSGSSVAFIS